MPPHSLSLLSPLLLSPPPHTLSSKTATAAFFITRLPFANFRNCVGAICCTSRRLTHQEAVLQSIAESNERILPCVRTFENDLSRLSLVGPVDFEQALTAAAADGGLAAADHIASGVPAMVVETVFPAPADDHATVSTRLFLPAKRVEEKARKLKKSISEDIFSGATPQNILAMTFRQVVLQQLWNFELIVFRPGTERDMEDLENPREVPVSFYLSSSDENVISVLAEAICIAALQNTERQYLDEFLGSYHPGSLFRWFRKSKRMMSKDSSVIIDKLFEDEIVENAQSLFENFNSAKGSFTKMRHKYNWWTPLTHSKLEKIGGPLFSSWTSEFVPAYRLEIDADKVKEVKFEGWRKCVENRWEVLLTHSQMVGLAEILDMYYEDTYSLPSKELPCSYLANFTSLSNKKLGSSLMNILAITLASGIFIITLAALGHFHLPRVLKGLTYTKKHKSLPSSEIEPAVNEFQDAAKLQEYCISVVKKVKDAFGWPYDIATGANIVAWIGEIPNYLKMMCESDSSSEENSADSSSIRKVDAHMMSSAQDIASYKVVLSSDGKIVGIQPTSSTAENQWGANPLAKELYGEKKLSSGKSFVEPDLETGVPREVVIIELLMSVNSEAHFALARPG